MKQIMNNKLLALLELCEDKISELQDLDEEPEDINAIVPTISMPKNEGVNMSVSNENRRRI